MRIDKAGSILATFWALAELIEKDEIPSYRKIENLLNVSDKVVESNLDYLERCGAITRSYPKQHRQGKRDMHYSLFPEKIPAAVYESKPSYNAIRAWNKKISQSDVQLAHYQNGKLMVNGKRIVDVGGESFLKAAQKMFKQYHPDKPLPHPNELELEIVKTLNGSEVAYKDDYLKDFRNFLCLKVKKMHSDADKHSVAKNENGLSDSSSRRALTQRGIRCKIYYIIIAMFLLYLLYQTAED